MSTHLGSTFSHRIGLPAAWRRVAEPEDCAAPRDHDSPRLSPRWALGEDTTRRTREAPGLMSLLIASGFVSVKSCTLALSTPSMPLPDILVSSGVCPNTPKGLTWATCAT